MSVDIYPTNCDQCQSMVQCCFTPTETIRLIRTVTSTLTQLRSSELSIILPNSSSSLAKPRLYSLKIFPKSSLYKNANQNTPLELKTCTFLLKRATQFCSERIAMQNIHKDEGEKHLKSLNHLGTNICRAGYCNHH